MRRMILVVLLLGIALALGSCSGGDAPTPSPATSTPALIPTVTPQPPPPPLPTASGPFLPIGYVAELQGQAHGVAGQARVVADRQILVRGFSYDGQGQDADIRLAREGQLDQPLAVLTKLDRSFQNSALVLAVPPDLKPGVAEVIAVYSAAEGKAYGVGKFEEGKAPTPQPPTPTPTGGPFDSPKATPGS